jgi:uroporphyrinogen-III synthase
MSQTSILSTKTLTDEQRKVLLDANLIFEQDFIEIKNNL